MSVDFKLRDPSRRSCFHNHYICFSELFGASVSRAHQGQRERSAPHALWECLARAGGVRAPCAPQGHLS